jgi:glycosyltransferase involved in cell wall biosynthesis
VSPRLHAWEARLTAAADETIVCSESMRAELAQLFAARPHVIPCGLAARSAPPAAPGAGGADALALPPRGAGGPVLAFLGRLVPEKGVQVLLQALPHLHALHPALTLVIAGAGPLRPELEALAAPFGDRVRFAGFLAEPAKSALLARADLVVVPSLYEPFGLVALEAMAAGTPLLVSDVGGLADIVEDGVTGLKFPPGDAAALAERAASSLGNAAAAQARAAAALATVRERFAIARVAAETARVYMSAIRKRGASQLPAEATTLRHAAGIPNTSGS